VGAEPGARLVADDGRRAGDLAACPIEHAPIDACLRARGPRQVLMSQDDSFAVVRVDEHRSLGRPVAYPRLRRVYALIRVKTTYSAWMIALPCGALIMSLTERLRKPVKSYC